MPKGRRTTKGDVAAARFRYSIIPASMGDIIPLMAGSCSNDSISRIR